MRIAVVLLVACSSATPAPTTKPTAPPRHRSNGHTHSCADAALGLSNATRGVRAPEQDVFDTLRLRCVEDQLAGRRGRMLFGDGGRRARQVRARSSRCDSRDDLRGARGQRAGRQSRRHARPTRARAGRRCPNAISLSARSRLRCRARSWRSRSGFSSATRPPSSGRCRRAGSPSRISNGFPTSAASHWPRSSSTHTASAACCDGVAVECAGGAVPLSDGLRRLPARSRLSRRIRRRSEEAPSFRGGSPPR